MGTVKWTGTSAIELIMGILLGATFKNLNQLSKPRFNHPKDAGATPHLSLTKQTNFAPMINVQNGDKVKLVAFGDSITAGLDTQYGVGMGGYLEASTHTIYGLGYTAHFARALEQVVPGSVQTFMDYGISSTTTDHWLYLLGLDELDGKPLNSTTIVETTWNGFIIRTTTNTLQAIYNYVLQRNQESKFPYVQQRLIDAFGGNSRTIDRSKFIQAIKDANEIMFTIGANDVFASGVFTKAIGILKDAPEEWPEVKNELHAVWDLVKTRIVAILQRVRALNSCAHINVVSYPLALVRIADDLDDQLQLPAVDGDSFSQYFDRGLNNALKQAVQTYNAGCSYQERAEYLDCFDEQWWRQFADRLAEDPFSIHPTCLGYQAMGQIIFQKMVQQEFDHNWSDQFVAKDWDTYGQQIILGVTDQQIQEQTGDWMAKNWFQNAWELPFDERVRLETNYLWRHVRKPEDFRALWRALYLENVAKFDDNGWIRELMGLASDDAVNQKTVAMWYELIIGNEQASTSFQLLMIKFADFIQGKPVLTLADFQIFWGQILAKTPWILDLLNQLYDDGFMYDHWSTIFEMILGWNLGLSGIGDWCNEFYELIYNTLGGMVKFAQNNFQSFDSNGMSLSEAFQHRWELILSTGQEMNLLMEIAQLLPDVRGEVPVKQWFRILTFARYWMLKWQINGAGQLARFTKMTLKRVGIRETVIDELMAKWFGEAVDQLLTDSLTKATAREQLKFALVRGGM